MTFIPDILCPNVMKWALEALEPEGVYLIPVVITSIKGNFIIQPEVYEDGQPKGNHVIEWLKYGINIDKYNGHFPDHHNIRKGCEILDEWVRKSYPDSPIKTVSLNPSPLMRAFWNLPETEQKSLCKPIELDLLAHRLMEMLQMPHKEQVDPVAQEEMLTGLKKKLEEAPLMQLCASINLRLDKVSFIEKAKKEAQKEQDRFGDFFGPSGTTFVYGYSPEMPLFTVPAYITIVKS